MTKILFQDIVLDKNPARALDRILQLPALKKYYTLLPSDRERNDFRRHAAKYLNIWLPDCAFEVSFTNRYMLDHWEAKTTARKFIKTGDRIKYLCGELVQISPEEQDDEKFIENAFSITYSSRRRTPSLFLGPARFANHDCNANAKLESRGSEGMLVIAVRDIEVGDEINVHYGDNYFGVDNCECLCASCEKYGQGAWPYGTEESGAQTPRAGSQEANDPGSRRSKRKRNIVDYKQRLREANTRMEEEHPAKRRRAEVEYNGRAEEWTPTPDVRDLPRKLQVKPKEPKEKPVFKTPTKPIGNPRTAAMLTQITRSAHSALPAKSSAAIKDDFNRSPFGRRWIMSVSPKLIARGRRSTSSSMGGGPSRKSIHKSTMLFSFLKQARDENENRLKRKAEPAQILAFPSVELDSENAQDSPLSSEEASVFDVNNAERHTASPVTEPPSVDDNVVEQLDPAGDDDIYSADQITTPTKRRRLHSSRLGQMTAVSTTLQDSIETQTDSQDTPKRAKTTPPPSLPSTNEPIQPIAVTEITTVKTPEPETSGSRSSTPVSPTSSKANTTRRIPGDYHRTDRLLGPKNTRWIDCGTCDDVFLQFDSNQVRRECPRCERHSKLYGFRWPQTDYEKGEQTQKRVMDHRTVNRFLSRAEEAEMAKKGKNVGGETLRSSSRRL